MTPRGVRPFFDAPRCANVKSVDSGTVAMSIITCLKENFFAIG